MSGFSSHGVGAAACANADVASPVSTAAIKKVFENLVIVVPPGGQFGFCPSLLNKSRTSLFRQCHLRRITLSRPLCDLRLRDYVPISGYKRGYCQKRHRMIRMNLVMKTGFVVALSFMTLASIAQADEFKLSNNQRISCSRGLSAGKLNTATCKSYAYVFNVKTSEYYRCQVTLALTRDNKEVINVQTDGSCTKKPRIFEADSSYSFDATETEPPNTNSFFGTGGYAVWASDNNALKVRGCITISSGLGSDISKCLEMAFQ